MQVLLRGDDQSIGPGQMQLRRARELEQLGYVTARSSDLERVQALLGEESSVEYVAGMLHFISDRLPTLPGYGDLSSEDQMRLILIGYNEGWTERFLGLIATFGLEGLIFWHPYDDETFDEYLRWLSGQ